MTSPSRSCTGGPGRTPRCEPRRPPPRSDTCRMGSVSTLASHTKVLAVWRKYTRGAQGFRLATLVPFCRTWPGLPRSRGVSEFLIDSRAQWSSPARQITSPGEVADPPVQVSDGRPAGAAPVPRSPRPGPRAADYGRRCYGLPASPSTTASDARIAASAITPLRRSSGRLPRRCLTGSR